MKKRTRQIRTKLRSKKGMTLVELIVGIVIIVIVFSATLSAMTNGYSDTIYNADVNKSAVKGGSLNEVIMEAIIKQGLTSADDDGDSASAQNFFFAGGKTPADGDNPVHSAAVAVIPSVRYVPYGSFYENQKDEEGKVIENKYTININATRTIKDLKKVSTTIKGIEILTCVTNSKGTLINSSFVPYARKT